MLDASLLTLPLHGYISGTHPRMRSTYRRIVETLGAGPLVYRNRQEIDAAQAAGTHAEKEGAFGICSFWAAECQALTGDVDGAGHRFERLCAYANDVGLFSEEIDPDGGTLLGNFPQGFTHVGLINAALTLEQCRHEVEASGRLGAAEPKRRSHDAAQDGRTEA